jgi:hypothetical protein
MAGVVFVTVWMNRSEDQRNGKPQTKGVYGPLYGCFTLS